MYYNNKPTYGSYRVGLLLINETQANKFIFPYWFYANKYEYNIT